MFIRFGSITRSDQYASAMAGVHYLRVPERLPADGHVADLARYWKRHYNTSGGKGSEEHFVEAWNPVMT